MKEVYQIGRGACEFSRVQPPSTAAQYNRVVMKNILPSLQRIRFTERSAPLALFAACVLGFGLTIPSLGFYMDDWPYVFYAYNKGVESLREMLLYDSRPYAAWLYILAFKALGFKPLYWHIAALLMRWLTAVLFWKTLSAIWRDRARETISVALLFAVYPFFMLQPFAVGSTHHWAGFIFFNLSLYLTTLAAQRKKYFWLTVPAALLQAVHLFTSEYFAGLELLRPLILWILLSRYEPRVSKRFWRTFLQWLPYLLVLGTYAYWRAFLFQNVEGVTRNTPVILNLLFREPLKAIGFLLTASVKDAVSVMTIGWQNAVSAELLDFNSVYARFRMVVSAAAFGLAFLYLGRLDADKEPPADDWTKTSALFAAAGLMVGGLPVWLIGRYILESKNLLSASRFGIPSMLGAAFLLVLVIDYFVSDKNKRTLLLALCLALAVNFHLNNAKEFQYSWEKQERFLRQLLWRAPQIEEGAALLTDEEILGMMGEYAVSFSIITAYQPGDIDAPPYWYFPFYYANPDVDALLQGAPLEYGKLSMNFSGDSKKMLLLSFNPEMKRCLWVMQPQDVNLRLVSDDMRKLSAGSDISLIGQGANVHPPEVIYGKEDTQTWCYYFEKADLARQYGQWAEIARLWEESQAVGERADNGFEYIPFIEGYGHLEEWEYVKKQTKFANKITSGLEPSLCSMLDRLAASAPPSPQRDDTIGNLKDDLKCVNYQ
ncbi:MAG: hypothetical protein LDL51_03435 [Chloroflexi bacterium]|nr:hypothetical protein [Chloroflexota bacterium]